MIYKRELEAIALNLRYSHASRPTDPRSGREQRAWDTGFRAAVDAIADALHLEMGLDRNGNRRFRRERFLEAAGVETREETKE